MNAAQQLTNLRPSYIRDILQAANQPGMISLAGGLPAEELFPMQLIQQGLQQISQQPNCFQYANTEGLPALRATISQQFSGSTASNLLITTGSQQGLDLIARSYLNPGDTVLMEAPCYLGALQVFKLAQAQTCTVEQDTEGPNLEQLEQQLKQQKPKLFYAVPDFHNPTGLRWSTQRRHEVAQLLARYQVTLIEDAPYRALSFDGQQYPTVSSLLQQPSFYLGSFSKIACPGIRLGYVHSTETLLRPLIQVKQAADLHSSMPMQQLTHYLLSQPDFVDHLSQLRRRYRQRHDCLSQALSEQLAEHIRFKSREGGMFLWLELTQMDARALTERALEQQVAIVPGDVFWPQGVRPKQAVRLNFSHCDETTLQQAVTRLARCFTD